MDVYFNHPPMDSDAASIRMTSPALFVQDRYRLSDHQRLLRQQIEIFEAGEDDVMTHTRGRNHPITYGQVGVRCKHCSHIPVSRRQKGSTYFPSNKLGLYQAAQNMSVTHIQCGLCNYMPESIKQQFVQIMSNRQSNTSNIGAGRPYWAKSATRFGLIDTERGIRFIRTLQSQPYGMTYSINNDTI
jgi:hypothetical protein